MGRLLLGRAAYHLPGINARAHGGGVAYSPEYIGRKDICNNGFQADLKKKKEQPPLLCCAAGRAADNTLFFMAQLVNWRGDERAQDAATVL